MLAYHELWIVSRCCYYWGSLVFNQFKTNFQQNDLWNEWKDTKTSKIYGLGVDNIVPCQELEQHSPKKGIFFSFPRHPHPQCEVPCQLGAHLGVSLGIKQSWHQANNSLPFISVVAKNSCGRNSQVCKASLRTGTTSSLHIKSISLLRCLQYQPW